MSDLSTKYNVSTVNEILNTVYTNNSSTTVYALPLEPEDRTAFDIWLDTFPDKGIINYDYATATLRIYYLSLLDCNNECLCIPPLLSELGFGVKIDKTETFNYKNKNRVVCC
jgi:hypothetical protein